MKQTRIVTPKPKTTLPQHEIAARYLRARILALPSLALQCTRPQIPFANFHQHRLSEPSLHTGE